MMKEEFEQLAGCSVSSEAYSRIERCYVSFEKLFPTKKDVALFYQTFGMDGIDRLFSEIAGFEKVTSSLKEYANSECNRNLRLSSNYCKLYSHVLGLLRGLVDILNSKLDDPLFCSIYSSPDNSKFFFLGLIDYLNKEIKQFESEV